MYLSLCPLDFPLKPGTLTSPLPCVPHVPPISFSLTDLANNIWWWVQIMKLPIVQLPPFSCYFFIPLRSRYSLRTLFSNTLSLSRSFGVRDQVSYPYKTSWKVIIVYVLIITFLDRRGGGDKRLNRIVASIPRICLLLIFPCMQFLSVSVVPKIFELRRIFKGPIWYLYGMLLFCFLVTWRIS
jgi:hypothetical protein